MIIECSHRLFVLRTGRPHINLFKWPGGGGGVVRHSFPSFILKERALGIKYHILLPAPPPPSTPTFS